MLRALASSTFLDRMLGYKKPLICSNAKIFSYPNVIRSLDDYLRRSKKIYLGAYCTLPVYSQLPTRYIPYLRTLGEMFLDMMNWHMESSHIINIEFAEACRKAGAYRETFNQPSTNMTGVGENEYLERIS